MTIPVFYRGKGHVKGLAVRSSNWIHTRISGHLPPRLRMRVTATGGSTSSEPPAATRPSSAQKVSTLSGERTVPRRGPTGAPQRRVTDEPVVPRVRAAWDATALACTTKTPCLPPYPGVETCDAACRVPYGLAKGGESAKKSSVPSTRTTLTIRVLQRARVAPGNGLSTSGHETPATIR